jgi:thioredoxin reductase (NADPH)
VEFILDTVVDEIVGVDNKVTKLKLRNLKTEASSELEVGAVFPFVGFLPNSNIFRDHVEHDELGYLFTDMNMATNVKGIYAAGDVRHQLTKQITTAVGDGTTAVVAVTKLLEERQHGHTQGVPDESDTIAAGHHQLEV